MEILSFKIKGKFGHFRKYYANNTAFSFSIPPRTTLMGIIAATLGYPKDSYYKKLASDQIHFGIRVLSPLKKSFQRLNFLSIKKTGDLTKNLDSDFRGQGGRIQTPFEIVSAHNISRGEVKYQIFIGSTEQGATTFDEIKNWFIKNDPVFNLSLGIANFQATIYDIEFIEPESIAQKGSNDFVLINSAIPSKFVEELDFEKDNCEQYNFIEEDLLPSDFVDNYNREVGKMNRLLYSITNLPLKIRINSSFWNIHTESEDLNIKFMDV